MITSSKSLNKPNLDISPVPAIKEKPWRESTGFFLFLDRQKLAFVGNENKKTPQTPKMDAGFFLGLLPIEDQARNARVAIHYFAPQPPSHYCKTLIFNNNNIYDQNIY